MEGVSNAMATSPGGFLIAGGQERLIPPPARWDRSSRSATWLMQRCATDGATGAASALSLAEVKRDAALKRGDASFNGKPAAVLMVPSSPTWTHPP